MENGDDDGEMISSQ